MTLKTYLRINRYTTESYLKIVGLLFTSIFVAIGIFTEFRGLSLRDSINKLIIIFFLGNAFAVLMLLLAILSAYTSVRQVEKFFINIPQEIKEKYGFIIGIKRLNPKYNFLQFEIFSSNTEEIIFLELFRKDKKVRINIMNTMSRFGNIQKLMLDIQKKYRKKNININGIGFCKYIKIKDWKKIDESTFEEILADLIEVSAKENIELVRRKIE